MGINAEFGSDKHSSTLKKEIKGEKNQRTYGEITRSSWKDEPGKKKRAWMHSTDWESGERLSSSSRSLRGPRTRSLCRSHLYGGPLQPHFPSLLMLISIQIGCKPLFLKTCLILFQKSVEGLTLLEYCPRGWLFGHSASCYPSTATSVAGKFKFSSSGWREGLRLLPHVTQLALLSSVAANRISSPSQLSQSCQWSKDAPALNIAWGWTRTFSQRLSDWSRGEPGLELHDLAQNALSIRRPDSQGLKMAA